MERDTPEYPFGLPAYWPSGYRLDTLIIAKRKFLIYGYHLERVYSMVDLQSRQNDASPVSIQTVYQVGKTFWYFPESNR